MKEQPPAQAAPSTQSNQLAAAISQAMLKAATAYARGDWAEAEGECRKILATRGEYFGALNLLGIIAAQTRRTEEAASLLRRAVAANPTDAAAHNNYANVLNELKRFENALESYERALKIRPDYVEAYNNRGNTLRKLKRFADALASYERALKLKPDFADAWNNRGNTLSELKSFEEALDSYGRALKSKPNFARAHNNRGLALQELKRFEEALNSYTAALNIEPDYVEAHYNCGNVLQELKRFEEALESYERALKIKPDYAEAWNNRGNALSELKRFDQALDSYARAVQIKPNFAAAYHNRGATLQELEHFEEALDSYARALKIKPDFADAANNRGVTLQRLGRLEEALESYALALKIKPDFAEAHNNRGVTLQKLERCQEALESYESALRIKPEFARAYDNRGLALQELKRFEEALDSFTRALKIQPDSDWTLGTWLHMKMHVCDWSDLDSWIADLVAKIQQGKKASPPFSVLALIDSLSLQRQAAETWVREKCPPSRLLPPIAKCGRHERIRVGYFSRDYRTHPVSMLTAEMFERHDRSRFEVYAFSFGPDTRDEMRKRMERAFDRFIDVRSRSDLEIVQLARSMELDIAVDLGGFTEGSRPSVFAMRSAPLQVSYLGYPGTLGAEYIDYLIADPTIVPLEHQGYYAEKIIYLPSYQANDSKRVISSRRFTREELGLPRTGFVFCCFNSNYKIAPGTFDSWMRILRQVEGSVLFLVADDATVQRNLRKEAAARGVAADRLVFGSKLPAPEYLARYRTADLFLDTLPYNAATTASDALWAGLPILTRMGESFTARVAASLLTAIGLPELVTTTPEHFEAMAIELSGDPGRLAELRDRLHGNRLTMPLFDTAQFTRHLENAYTQVYERYQADLSPDVIHCSAGGNSSRR